MKNNGDDKSMSKEIYFFAIRDDLINIINDVEKSIELQYVELKAYDSKNIVKYNSLKEFKRLGTNQSGEHQREAFLILLKSDNISIREIQQTQGGNTYVVDQVNNTDTVVFWPGGIYNKDLFLCGHIGTISDSNISKKIFNLFQKYIKKYFKTKVGRYYIGEHAKNICQHTRLITININQPQEYDVKLK